MKTIRVLQLLLSFCLIVTTSCSIMATSGQETEEQLPIPYGDLFPQLFPEQSSKLQLRQNARTVRVVVQGEGLLDTQIILFQQQESEPVFAHVIQAIDQSFEAQYDEYSMRHPAETSKEILKRLSYRITKCNSLEFYELQQCFEKALSLKVPSAPEQSIILHGISIKLERPALTNEERVEIQARITAFIEHERDEHPIVQWVASLLDALNISPYTENERSEIAELIKTRHLKQLHDIILQSVLKQSQESHAYLKKIKAYSQEEESKNMLDKVLQQWPTGFSKPLLIHQNSIDPKIKEEYAKCISSATITVKGKILSSGEMQELEVQHSSGCEEFDDYIIGAIIQPSLWIPQLDQGAYKEAEGTLTIRINE